MTIQQKEAQENVYENFSSSLSQKRKFLKKRSLKIDKYSLSNIQYESKYSLQKFQRSNQDTLLVQRPFVRDGDWVQTGDLLADCSASLAGELSLGKNILIAYMPWEGYNYEDAILISQRLVTEDIYTSIHIESYEVETKNTKLGREQITNEIPDVSIKETQHLDHRGIVQLGTSVKEGDILVGKVTPIQKKFKSAYEKLLYTILEKELIPMRDSSLRTPKGLKGKVIEIKILNSSISDQKNWSKNKEKISFFSEQKKQKKTFSADSFQYVRKYTTMVKKRQFHMRNLFLGNTFFKKSIRFTGPDALSPMFFSKIHTDFQNFFQKEMVLSSFRFCIPIQQQKEKQKRPEKVQVYLAEKRKIQVGDKMAGRHGNKGIVSQILPIEDMPFLPDGTPLDMVLNPLGVPSRMNVGQIYECILGLASKYLNQYYRIQPFDEIYGPEASRSFTFSKLYEARLKTTQKWLFNPAYPGKIQIFDGRTGEPYMNPVTVGIAYILKLVHLVDDKIHARSTGPYSLVTQQPLRGRSKYGGQRLGEMEVWAIEAYGAAFILLEMLTIKSDDISGRMTLWSNILLNMPIYIGTPESFKVLVCELQALCLDMGLYQLNKKGFLKQIQHLMQLP
jgi:DNA-directed RNA polymerase subunit beta